MDFIAIDFETATSKRYSACELGVAVVKNGKITDSFSRLIQPPGNYYFGLNIDIHGITPEMTADSPTFGELWEELLPHFDGNNVIAHNAAFDIGVLRYALEYYEHSFPEFLYSCSVQISRRTWKGLPSYGLSGLCDYFGIPLNHHRAEPDARACAEIALRAFNDKSVKSFSELSEKMDLRPGRVFNGGYDAHGSAGRQTSRKYSKASGKFPFPNYKISEIEYDKSKAQPGHPFFGKTVVFTGQMASMERREAQKMVLEMGGRCLTSISGKTAFLIVGAQSRRKTSKLRKAEELKSMGKGIQIWSEKDFLEIF